MYIVKSSGDEGATQGQPKGVVIGVIQGKAYFESWSQYVKVKGLCVTCHQDMMTHNHGSFPSNMAAFPYAGCSYRCIREQLEEFYKMCRGSRAKVVNEQGKEPSKENEARR